MDALDARSMRHFLAVARAGSIRGAAEYLNIVPSAVSRQVADGDVVGLEEAIPRLVGMDAEAGTGMTIIDRFA